MELITDRTQADIDNKADKGHYNAEDFNRVSAACYELQEQMRQTGYSVEFDLSRIWTMYDYPTAAATQSYLDNVYRVIAGYFAYRGYGLPESMAAFGFSQANAIEQALQDIATIAGSIRRNPICSGRMGAGQKGVIR